MYSCKQTWQKTGKEHGTKVCFVSVIAADRRVKTSVDYNDGYNYSCLMDVLVAYTVNRRRAGFLLARGWNASLPQLIRKPLPWRVPLLSHLALPKIVFLFRHASVLVPTKISAIHRAPQTRVLNLAVCSFVRRKKIYQPDSCNRWFFEQVNEEQSVSQYQTIHECPHHHSLFDKIIQICMCHVLSMTSLAVYFGQSKLFLFHEWGKLILWIQQRN